MRSHEILQRAHALHEQMVAWRRDIHMHPELGFQEFRTAGLVADNLRALGLEVQTGVGKTGVVATLGDGGVVVGIRADMDALPIREANGQPFTSLNNGVMHACGHDAHTAMLLGAARILNDLPERPAGEIRFLFQPAEEIQDDEGKSGGMRMVEEGAMDGVDRVIALHVNSLRPTGEVEIIGGAFTAAADSFEATIHGVGCHGAYPHTGVDPIYLLGQVINAVQGIRARRVNPMQTAVVTIGSVHGGSADNVIPDAVELRGTLRSYDAEVREQLIEELERAFGVACTLGGDYTLTVHRGYPPTINDPAVARLLSETALDVGGGAHLRAVPEPGMGAEDFAYMTERAPGAMFNLGAKLDETHRPHHSPLFDIDEAVLPIGAAILAEAACRLLEGGAGR
jgi:amidohydrolase